MPHCSSAKIKTPTRGLQVRHRLTPARLSSASPPSPVLPHTPLATLASFLFLKHAGLFLPRAREHPVPSAWHSFPPAPFSPSDPNSGSPPGGGLPRSPTVAFPELFMTVLSQTVFLREFLSLPFVLLKVQCQLDLNPARAEACAASFTSGTPPLPRSAPHKASSREILLS